MDRKFYVKTKDNNIAFVTEEEIASLAYFATTLDFMPELKTEYGINVQLDTFFKQNQNHMLSDLYSKVNSSPEGNLLLNFNIALTDLERKFRHDGIKNQSIQSYNDLVIACGELFDNNNEEFSIYFNQNQPN